MNDLQTANNCSLTTVANRLQLDFDFDKDFNNPPPAVTDPDELKLWEEQRKAAVNNVAVGRMLNIPATNPDAPEVRQAFDAYVANYQNSSMHNSSDFDEWREGCGSASEALWLNEDICPCDCKKINYINNGQLISGDVFFVLPSGKNAKSPVLSQANLVINGKIIKRDLIAFSSSAELASSSVLDRNNIGAGLKTKSLLVSSERKQEFILA